PNPSLPAGRTRRPVQRHRQRLRTPRPGHPAAPLTFPPDGPTIIMIDLRRILVPTDFSKSSQNALTYAAAFAEKFGAELHLLHVVQDLALFIPEAVFVAPPPAPPVEQFVAAARTPLDRVLQELRLPGLP